MAVDLRQVMAAVLTFSMFIMLGNMIKRDHIDPFLEPLPASIGSLHDDLKGSKPGTFKLTEMTYGPWQDQSEVAKPCWKKPIFKGETHSNGYIFFSLSNGPEFHASQIANAVIIARHLGATLAIPDIRGSKLGQKMPFGEIYDVEKFVTSLKGIVRFDKNPPADLSKLAIVKVPERVSEDFIASKIKPIFHSKGNLKIVTYFDSSTIKPSKLPNAYYQCVAMFESLKLQKGLQEVVDSMVGTLRSLSKKTGGKFVAVDLRVDMLGEKECRESDFGSKKCYNAEEIGGFLKKIGFHNETTIYLTQTGWEPSLNALRNVFPNTFTKDAIMPADEKAKFMDLENHAYEKFIDYYMCAQGDAFVPAYPSKFYEGVVGERIGLSKAQIYVPSKNTSDVANDYISPYIANKSHFAQSCFC